ncbi:MAG: 3-keto-L-gulonate transporter [Desulfonatronovibrio sp. MSAO_Bac4]|nr:MAG: 3-keto-L-gulonate transporter [Desulfonatronovibrio sp. MSAO_Bac4]
MFPVSLKALFKCFLRSYLTAGAFNTRGMQNIGLAYALDPGLKEIYSDAGKLQKARRRHIKLYNTHPIWNPLLIGLFLSLERKIARDLFPAPSLPKVKSTLVFTLSAIGDSFFSGSLLITWSLISILLLFSGMHHAAIGIGIVFLMGVQIFKVYTFYMGLTQGLVFINNLKKWNLINWGSRLKVFNCLLVLAFWLVIWPFNWHIYSFILISFTGLVLTYMYRNIAWTRELFLVFILSLLMFVPESLNWIRTFL